MKVNLKMVIDKVKEHILGLTKVTTEVNGWQTR